MLGKLFLAFCVAVLLVGGDEYDNNIRFSIYTEGKSLPSFFNETTTQHCDKGAKFSIITHGWMGSTAPWIEDLISNLTVFRGGCTIFMNYSYYSDTINYAAVVVHFQPISNLLLRKLNQLKSEGVTGDQIFMFGFSFGGRLVIDAALNFGTSLIDKIDSNYSL